MTKPTSVAQILELSAALADLVATAAPSIVSVHSLLLAVERLRLAAGAHRDSRRSLVRGGQSRGNASARRNGGGAGRRP